MSEIDKVVGQFQKEWGKEIGQKGVEVKHIRRVPTDIFQFDLATGGGWLRSRMNILYGPESSGKTNLALRAIRHVQKHCWECDRPHEACICTQGATRKVAVFIDVEHSYDSTWGQVLGIDNEALYLMEPVYAEQAVDMLDAVVQAEEVGIVVIDSVAAMVKHNTVASSSEKMEVSGSALLMSVMVRKMMAALAIERKRGHDPCILCINQIRSKVGVIMGNPETMPGGHSLRFNSCLTVRVSGKDENDKEISANVPAYKDTSAVIKKAKCPIVNQHFEYKICLLPQDQLKVGDSPSWNTVSSYLKDYSMVGKMDNGKGWLCMGMDGVLEEYPTLKAIQTRYIEDLVFQGHLRNIVLARELASPSLFEVPE